MIHRHQTLLTAAVMLFILALTAPARAQQAPVSVVPPVAPTVTAPVPPTVAGSTTPPAAAPSNSAFNLPDLSNRQTFSSAMQMIVLLTVLSLVPAILIMMTSFTRIVIVLSLLRQALGTQQLPPNQIITGLAMFMTFLVMGPTLSRVNSEALQPWLNPKTVSTYDNKPIVDQKQALEYGMRPLRDFMIGQIRKYHNDADVLLFTNFAHEKTPDKWEDVGTFTLIPAFVLSELKTAFLLGFRVYLPFLIIDMVISSVLISMGMMMLPPALISLPFKLLLFVMVDGWHLITAGLMVSFQISS
jgi:flagellar biosynthetic protein FliP